MKISILRLLACAATLVAFSALEASGPGEQETLPPTRDQESVAKPSTYKVAIFVSSRAGKLFDSKIATLEDFVTAGVTDLGVSVISRETALDAVGSLKAHETHNSLDEEMSDSTSAVRLAQTLGADYLLQVTLSSAGATKNVINAYGVKTINVERTVRITYKVLDGITGASLTADTVRASRTTQLTENTDEQGFDVMNDLLDEAAKDVASSLKSRIDRGRLAVAKTAQKLVTVAFRTEVADLMIPDVRVGAENTITISESKFKVTPLAATVEVDGIAIGTAPGIFQVKPGLSKLRVTREGFDPWERTVNFVDDLKLTVVLQMSAAGYSRWQDSTAFLNVLKNGAKLTDAAVKELEGRAKMLEQSGFKVDTNDAPTIEMHSVFQH